MRQIFGHFDVCEISVHSYQSRQIRQRHPIHHTKTACVGAEFNVRLEVTEIIYPIVEVVSVLIFHCFVVEVTLHREDFGKRVADWRTCCENNAAFAVVHLRQQFCLEVHVGRAFCIGCRQTDGWSLSGLNVQKIWVIAQILKHVRFVDKNLVDAQFFKRQANFFLRFVRVGFKQLVKRIVSALQCLFVSRAAATRFLQIVEFLFDNTFLFSLELLPRLERNGQAFKQGVRNDNAVPIVHSYCRQNCRAFCQTFRSLFGGFFFGTFVVNELCSGCSIHSPRKI